MIDVNACPKCRSRSYLALKSGIEPNSLVVECDECGFTMKLETKLPASPQEIIKEWNRRVEE